MLRRLFQRQPSSYSKKSREIPDGVEVEELNDLLQVVAEVHPDADAYTCRQALLHKSTKPRLVVALNQLFESTKLQRTRQHRQLEPWEHFRSDAYKSAVSKTL